MDTSYLEKLTGYTFIAEQLFAKALTQPECMPIEEAHKLFSHILAAQQIWLERIEGVPMSLKPFDLLAPATYPDLIQAHKTRYGNLLNTFKTTGTAGVIKYKNLAGTEFSSPADEIVLHICNHSTYHRGQINRILRQSGATPIAQDYIFYQRGELTL